MARSYANILTAIWDDEDFCALSAGAQRTYFMLVTQPDINACGTLALTLRRWSLTLAARDRKNLAKWLDELAAATFIVLEERTEEVLVRTFVKHDGGFKNPKRLAAIWATAAVIRSTRIKSVFGIEMAKLGLSNGDRTPIECPSNALRMPFDRPRVVVTEVDTDSTTPKPQPGEPSASDAEPPPSPFCSKHPNGTDDNCRACGTARKRYDQWVRDEPSRRDAARSRVQNCKRCHGGIWLDDGTKCDHSRRGT